VQLNGRGNPTATTLNLASEAELGGNASEYRLQTLTMRYGGTLKGSRLLANTVNANSTPTLIKSSDIYASALNVQGAKTVGLNVGNGKSVMSGTESNREMVWSNEYQQDKNGANSADYAKQFLLKSKGTPAADCSTPRDGVRKKLIRTCSAGGNLYGYWDETKCDYVPEQYIGIQVECITRYCYSETWEETDSVNVNQLRKFVGGCRLDRNSPLKIDLYHKAGSSSSYSRLSLSPGELFEWEDGWNAADIDGYSVYLRKFAVDNKGAQVLIRREGDCSYKIELSTDITDEDDFYGPYCRRAADWM